MSAIARELAQALKSHPNKPNSNSNILICCANTELSNNKDETELNFNLKTILSDEFQLVEIIDIEKLKNFNSSKCFSKKFFAIILSNIFNIEKYNKILSDELLETIKIYFNEILKLVDSNGIVIIRENFEHQSAHLIAELTQFIDGFHDNNNAEAIKHGLKLYAMNQVKDSIYAKSNFLDVFWTLNVEILNEIPMEENKNGFLTTKINTISTREFLDKTQYTKDNVKTYEWIFGKDFISPGGIDENRRVLGYFKRLEPGQKMLDIGVGIGGGARQIAREFGVYVLGCDLSSNMIIHAFERNQRDKDHRVEFQIADVMTYKYPSNSFDLIFSRDCIQHINDTKKLFSNIYSWLKPGGQFLVTAYGKGYGKLQPKFLDYVKQRKYVLRNLEEFCGIANEIGFVNVYAENMTPRFREILYKEREKVIKNKDEFVKKFGQKCYEKQIESWADKLEFINNDNHNWLLLKAEKSI